MYRVERSVRRSLRNGESSLSPFVYPPLSLGVFPLFLCLLSFFSSPCKLPLLLLLGNPLIVKVVLSHPQRYRFPQTSSGAVAVWS